MGGTALAQGIGPLTMPNTAGMDRFREFERDQALYLQSSISRMAPSIDPLSARDGCEDIPGIAHNSADCSRILEWDWSWDLPAKPRSEMSGAELNMLRNYRILVIEKQQMQQARE